jgi:GNAT superfamily N-acetyltransferase
MEIRNAVASDAAEACMVLRRSITELCAADHGNDAAILARWLENKTPENVAVWIARLDASMLVAAESGAIVAVGMVTDAGEIILNYVSPDARFRGVSRALLGALEGRAAERGAERCRLKHRNRAAVLPRQWLHRRQTADRQIRHGLRLSNGKGNFQGGSGEPIHLILRPPPASQREPQMYKDEVFGVVRMKLR